MLKDLYHTKSLTQMDDDSIIRSVLAGNKGCFRILVDRYGDDVLHTVGRVITSQEVAEEVVQDTFVEVYLGLDRYDRGKASFRTWLMRIAYYTALKQLRGKCVELHAEEEQNCLESVPDSDTDIVLDDTSPRRLTLLNKAIAQLSADDRMLLSLYYYDDRPIKEIAYITGRTDGYLRSRLQWLRKKLCKTIKNLEQNENQ